MATVLPTETPQYAFADYAEFNAQLGQGKVPTGSIIVGGKNFGCGSSREQAASCLKGPDLVIVAKHFARIFLQNSINLGLRTIICPDIEANEGDDLEISADKVINKTSGLSFHVIPLPKTSQAVIEAGGLIPFTRQRILKGEQR